MIKNLKKMSPKEKKAFLSNDLIERMIRVEKNVASTFGKKLKDSETEFFKSLSPSKKEEFKKYQKKKNE